jgi:hypothetical protein
LQLHAEAADPNNQSSSSSQPMHMHMSLGSRPTHLQPTEAYDAPSGAEARSTGSAYTGTRSASYGARGMHGSSRSHTSGAGTSTGKSPASPDAGALQRSASADYEDPDGTRGYVAADEDAAPGKVAAPGRVVGMHATGPVVPSHFGSAPMAAPAGRRGAQNPASLAAAAADAEDEEGLRMMGVRSALVSDEYGQQGGGI